MAIRVNILPAGFNQATPAMQLTAQRALGGRSYGTRRRRKARTTATRKRKAASRRGRSTRRASKPARLVKGSRAAKAWMAKIRRKRR